MSKRARLIAALLASTALAGSVLAGSVLAGSTVARAAELPSAPSVAYGAVTVGPGGPGTLSVVQTSPTAIVNWQSFSIGQGGVVSIQQPSTDAALLNRVTGTTTSTIAGQLTATGQVYLINPNGILITPTGTVKAGGGFVASTLDIADDDFIAGKRTFRGTGSSRGVVHQGSIEIGSGGYAALIGGSIDSSGTITVPLGKVGLGAGEQVTLDPSGDGFLQVALPSTGLSTDTDLIRHSGRIVADGGRVEMKAATARDLARNAINLSGIVEAKTVSGRSGAIVLGGGDGGRVTVSGKLTATAAAGSKAKGGSVTVTGKQVALKGARIDVSGDAGGGSVRIGGDYKGLGTLQRAETTSVDAGTTILADAGSTGTGGSVVIWSDRYTTFAGSIFARGGVTMGDGGQAEVSSKGILDYRGFTDLRASAGRTGTLLLDPYDLYIEAVPFPGNGNAVVSGSFLPSSDNSVLDVTVLSSALETANVTLSTRSSDGVGGSQAGDIIVGAPVTWSSASTLTLNAERIVDIGYGFNAPAGAVVINASSIKNDNTVARSNGTVTAAGGASALGGATLSQLDLTSDSAGSIVLNGTYDVGSSFSVTGGSVQFGGSVTAGSLVLSGTSLTSSGPISAGTFVLSSGTWSQVGSGGVLPAFTVTDLFALSPSATFLRVLSGDGVSTPYQLGDIYGVMGIGTSGMLGLSFALANDINAGGPRFDPITGTFTGTFDGQGHTISNLTIASSDTGTVGLFGTNAGQIRNLTLADVTVSSLGSGLQQVGGIAGLNDMGGVISNVKVTVADISSSDLTGEASVGGIVGTNLGTISGAAVVPGSGSGTVRGLAETTAVGGLVGANGGTIVNSYARVGIVFGGATVSRSAPATPTTINGAAGGLVGLNLGSIINSYSTGGITIPAVAGTATIVGGLVGLDNASPLLSTWDVETAQLVASFVGTVSNSFWDITASGLPTSAGGIALTTGQFQNTAGFMATASGWDFTSVWAPGGPGIYPALYGVDTTFYIGPLSVAPPPTEVAATFVSTSNPFTQPGEPLSFSTVPVSLGAGDELVGPLLNGGGGGSGSSGDGGGPASGTSGGSGEGGGSGSGGGPTLGSGQQPATVETARVTLTSIERSADTFQTRLSDCERGGAGYAGCVGDAMNQFASALDDRALQLPPPLRGISAVIREAAARVRSARTIGEARSAVRDALTAVRGAIALIKVDDPAVARIQVRQASTIRTALERVDLRLASAGGL
ncbi:filamentous hemagglutinin N-terminal domain-containing protein [uncultured Alsobacter sp.]|uniref:beta strand repeat-containing protein n=1 Tax=uncultured Alsobacter sp. TaxID=1748258 RepID=UPI0025CFD82C|nr:filamentous hemagglutinin N-terminal domain-containing protein [uncultured Alsobacter sp.]